MESPKVYEAISSVMASMAKEGIAKDRKNQQQGYSFRGIDDVYNALGKVLAENKLMLLPRVISRDREERTTAKGGLLIYTILTVEFDLVCSLDGSRHTVCMIGEAMDSADKSANKAQSAALKYAAMQVFMIPTEGDNDADAHTYEVKASKHKNYAILMGELNKGLMSDDIARMWKDAEFIKLRKEMPEEQQQQLHTEMTAIGKSLKAKETAKKDTVGAIKEEFPGSEVRDERITNVDGREVHPMEGF